MTGVTEYDNAFPNINVSQDSAVKMFQKLASFKIEERDLALDRFKRINESMGDDDEKFWVHGKYAILYLDSASKSSNTLLDMAKDIMKASASDNKEGNSNISGSLDVNLKNMINDIITKEQDGRTDIPTDGPEEDNEE